MISWGPWPSGETGDNNGSWEVDLRKNAKNEAITKAAGGHIRPLKCVLFCF